MAQRGCDVLTYKTIRSKAVVAHELPNIAFICSNKQITKTQIGDEIIASKKYSNNNNLIAIANSFGNASFDKNTTHEDIIRAKKYLISGQILIVSVYGESVCEFIDAAHIAHSAGADAIEINLSCPNLNNQNLENNKFEKNIIIISEIAKLGLPVIIKLGYYNKISELKNILVTITRAGARAVSGINSVPMRVINKHGVFVFNNRPLAGVSGNPIRNLALDFISQARKIIIQEKLGLALLGMGGISQAQHFGEFLNVGADIALSATGIMFNPNLPAGYHHGQIASCSKTL